MVGGAHGLKRGFAAGDVFYAAVAESNRREWEILERERQQAAAELSAPSNVRLRHSLRVPIGVAAVTAVAAIATALMI